MADRPLVPLPDPYPVMLDLRAVPVLVVGAGRIAARKAMGLLAAGAEVTAVAPEFHHGFPPEATRIARRYQSTDLVGRRLVITATGIPEVDAAVAADATAAGIWVNSADDPQNCSFILPAVVRRGPVTVAVSSGGASPALASHLRDQIAALVGPEYAAAAQQLAAERAAIVAAGGSTEALDWHDRVAAALSAARQADRLEP